MGGRFSKAYSPAEVARRPHKRLLKALLFQALCSIRPTRRATERIRFDLHYRWFLDMIPEE